MTNIWYPEPVRLDGAEVTVPALDPARPRRVTVRHLGRKLVGAVMLPTPDGKPATIRLQPWGGVTARAVGEDGKPRDNARLRLWYTDDDHVQLNLESFESLPAAVTTNADGRFRAEGLTPERRARLIQPITTTPPEWTVKCGEVEDLGTLTVVKIASDPTP